MPPTNLFFFSGAIKDGFLGRVLFFLRFFLQVDFMQVIQSLLLPTWVDIGVLKDGFYFSRPRTGFILVIGVRLG